MDYQAFYRQLFAPLEAILGPIDRETLMGIVGFDAGGPLSFCTIGCDRSDGFATYVSCELAVREDQIPSEYGRYELLTTTNDEEWALSILSAVGGMSLEVAFGDGHTLDIGSLVSPDAPLQGVVFEKVVSTRIDQAPYGVLRCIGIQRPEMELAIQEGSGALIERLQRAGVYPRTIAKRLAVA